MTKIARKEEEREFAEESDSLWHLTIAPTIWAFHFMISYAATAVICAKTEGSAGWMPLLQGGIGVLTVLALAAIGYIGWQSWRQWDVLDDYDYSHAGAREEDRHEFLGHAAFLLAIISFVGVLYVAMPAAFAPSCS